MASCDAMNLSNSTKSIIAHNLHRSSHHYIIKQSLLQMFSRFLNHLNSTIKQSITNHGGESGGEPITTRTVTNRSRHEQSRRWKMSRAHDAILKYLLKIMEVCKAQGFVYGIIPEKGKPITGSSESLRKWWKQEVCFHQMGPLAVWRYHCSTKTAAVDQLDGSGRPEQNPSSKESVIWSKVVNQEETLLKVALNHHGIEPEPDGFENSIEEEEETLSIEKVAHNQPKPDIFKDSIEEMGKNVDRCLYRANDDVHEAISWLNMIETTEKQHSKEEECGYGNYWGEHVYERIAMNEGTVDLNMIPFEQRELELDQGTSIWVRRINLFDF
ncbi:hypothetical protein L6452_09945 [Arctium lappa]|uniref:Uncharacterized protein n=1 Tax=Arctium lappa TaxID=4217 RepID=A0ACB9DLQ7_ARCLA|nr:hypothetical protein L6452_09945 [Arctium lappa]